MRRLGPLVSAGIVLGIGLGGFVDGIVLHQILGWHHVICSTAHCQPTSIEHLQRQNVQDGWFHAVVWLVTAIGVGMLFRAARTQRTLPWDGRALFGSLLAGWGIFNFVEGLIDHHLLAIHHVRPGHPNELWWDLGFLATGLIFGAIGWFLTASQRNVAKVG